MSANSNPGESLLQRLGITYEIRIRITLGLLFILIVIANLNSLRFFNQTISLEEENQRQQIAQNLNLIAATLRSGPIERLQSSAVRDLAAAAGFDRLLIVETDLLRDTVSGHSDFLTDEKLREIRRLYTLPKTIAGGIRNALPSTISETFSAPDGQTYRNAYFHFLGFDGRPLTLVAWFDAAVIAELERFALFNTLFQIVSLLAASAIALLLLKITFRPYEQIKSEAIAADVAQTDKPEAVDFAVTAFHNVIAELRAKEAKLQDLYAEQKQRAASLERYNEYVLRAMPTGVISCDVEGKLTRLNEAGESILGLNSATVIGQHYQNVLRPFAQLADLFTIILLRSESTAAAEIELKSTTGKRLALSVTGSPLRDASQQVQGAMILLTDLSELRSLEAQMRLNEHMAALGEMSAGLAHQLRNSMGAIVGFAQLLNKIGAAGTAAGIADNILAEARLTGEMLDRFLRLSRPSELALSEVNWRDLIDGVARQFEGILQSRRLKLRLSIADLLPALTGDVVLLSNTLANLLHNAIQASTNDSEIVIAIDHDNVAGCIEIRVVDYGRGIPDADIDKLFTPFFTSGKAGGTGLGLALAQKWVNAHGGRILVSSKLGQGTTFRIQLPTPRQGANTAEKILLANNG